MNDVEIIKLLGGVTAVARLLGIKPPSVHAWLTDGIPESRLIEIAAHVEAKSCGRFSRRERWPDRFGFIWPELKESADTGTEAEAGRVASFLHETEKFHG